MRRPALVGAAVVGHTLRASSPRWTQTPDSVTWRWLLCTARNCQTIRGAKGPALTLTRRYAGRAVQAVAVAKFSATTARTMSRRVRVRLR
jgi:hypothetical protein